MKTIQILNGDSLEVLKQFPDNYFDAVVTDPPYGLGKEPNAEEMLQAWITSGYLEVKGSGFMGKEWDAFVPQPIFWKEVFRVLKHGGHIVAFFGTRTYDWGVMSMRLAGFEIRDCIQWIYGSGFPKSHNIGKAIDKIQGNEREIIGKYQLPDVADGLRKKNWDCEAKSENSNFGASGQNIITKGSSEWEGWGSALKPANEPIVLARKPLEKGLSIAENVLKNGTGGINIDATRISFKDDSDYKESTQKNQHADFGTKPMTNNNVYGDYSMVEPKNYEPLGRFPANLILTHHPECECIGSKKVKGSSCKPTDIGKGRGGNFYGIKHSKITSSYIDENGEETIENWNCHEDCPIKIMDEQSGESKSPLKTSSGGKTFHGKIFDLRAKDKLGFNDKGGASRFFYVAKASKKERNKGLEGFEENQTKGGGGMYNEEAGGKFGSVKAPSQNFHPTIKPVALMRYLVRMITPPNGIVLDPFNGSGTTGVACKVEGFNYVGIELDAEYCKISEGRIEGWETEIEMPDTIQQKEVKKESAEEIQPKNQLNLF